MSTTLTSKPARHIFALCCGKDSSALAVFMKDKAPDIEYVFCDTEKDLLCIYGTHKWLRWGWLLF